MHSRKMTAPPPGRQRDRPPPHQRHHGHGSGTPLTERIDQEVDVYVFLFDRLGVKPPTAAGAK